MRTVVVIMDGDAVAGGGDLWAALESADTPVLDRLGRSGRVGAAALTPGGRASPGLGGGIGLLTLLGYPASSLAGV